MFVTTADLPRSLALCDHLPGETAKERCYSGVFMENSSSSTNLDHPSRYINAADLYYPCTRLAERYLKICYRYQSSHFSLITHQDWKKVADLCLGVPTSYQEECFRTVGTNQVGATPDMHQWKTNCASMPAAYQSTCVQGVVASLTYRFVGDVRKVEDFCRLTRPDLQEACLGQLVAATRDWSTSAADRRAWSDQLSSTTYQNWCTEDLLLSPPSGALKKRSGFAALLPRTVLRSEKFLVP